MDAAAPIASAMESGNVADRRKETYRRYVSPFSGLSVCLTTLCLSYCPLSVIVNDGMHATVRPDMFRLCDHTDHAMFLEEKEKKDNYK